MTTRARSRRRALPAGALVLAAAVLSAGCTHRHRPPPPWGTRPTTRSTTPAHAVALDLADGTIGLDGAITAGRTTVNATNTGTHEHEVIFIKAQSAASLPTKADGSVDESKLPFGSDIGEMELDSGASASKSFTFTPGRWVAVCNVDEGHSHFADGMYLEFTVA